MSSFPLPTSAEVAADSRLLPEQLNGSFDQDAMLADIDERIAAQALRVQGKASRAAAPYPWPFADDLVAGAYPAYSSDERSAEMAQQAALAREATKAWSLASLFRAAGQLNAEYGARATLYEQNGRALLDELLEAILFVQRAQPTQAAGGGAAVWSIAVGEKFVGPDEFGACAE